jgi:hypothetical protein
LSPAAALRRVAVGRLDAEQVADEEVVAPLLTMYSSPKSWHKRRQEVVQ